MNYQLIHEAPFIIVLPLILLAIISIFFGYITHDLFIGIGTNFWGNSLFVHPNHINLIEAEFAIPLYYKLLPLIGSLFGGFLALILYHLYPLFIINLVNISLGKSIYRFFNQKYWIDNIYNNLILTKILNFGYITNKVLDRGAIELIGPYGLVNSLKQTSKLITNFDTGFIPHYAIFIIVGIINIIILVFYVKDSRLFILLLFAILFNNINYLINYKN